MAYVAPFAAIQLRGSLPGQPLSSRVRVDRARTAGRSPSSSRHDSLRCESSAPPTSSSSGPATQQPTVFERAAAEGSPFALFLAPMEGLGDVSFRRAMAALGGFDEACTEFHRVPKNAVVRALVKLYEPHQTHPIPEAVQLMGSVEELMAEMTDGVIKRGAPRVDLNCGCPSSRATGRGAGSSLLRDPDDVFAVAKAMVDAARGRVPVSVKMRSGYDDTYFFDDILDAVQASGAAFVTLHPRTRDQGYRGEADWSLIARAKARLSIPVVGNGDVSSVEDALRMREGTGCDGVMAGRGAACDPWLFREIRARLAGHPGPPAPPRPAPPRPAPRRASPGGRSPRNWAETERFVVSYFESVLREVRYPRGHVSKLKELGRYLLDHRPELRTRLLKFVPEDHDGEATLRLLLSLMRQDWEEGQLEGRWGKRWAAAAGPELEGAATRLPGSELPSSPCEGAPDPKQTLAPAGA
eukprot:tig00021246_g19611.t1